VNVAASRLTSGNHILYGQLERELCRFFDAPSSLLVPTGYLTNLIVAQALAGNFSHALLDDEAHPSLSDAARLLDCPILRFKHRDSGDVARAVRRCGFGVKLLLLTDGLFPRDGLAAPLADYMRMLPKDAWLLVDDAHAAGVLGGKGRGSIEDARLSRNRIIQTITLSKAFGTYGGAIIGSARLRERVLEGSTLFAGSTPLPLPLVNGALQSVRLVAKHGVKFRRRLIANVIYVRETLHDAGLSIEDAPAPIISFFPANQQEVTRVSQQILRCGIYPPFVRYPGGPVNGYFRFVISSEHNRRQLDSLIEALIMILSKSGKEA
jgi:7-keto-8-aminopelargonate synthetase-like enzyme